MNARVVVRGPVIGPRPVRNLHDWLVMEAANRSGRMSGLGSPGGASPGIGSSVQLQRTMAPPIELLNADKPDIKYVQIPAGEQGTIATLKLMKTLVFGPWGARNPDVALIARKIVGHVQSKDYTAEAQAIFEYVKRNVLYRLDPVALEWLQTPRYTLTSQQGDCFVKGTKVLLRAGHKLVPIESLRIGDEVWGCDKWSRVESTWDRGVRPTYMILLNNGSRMRLTPEHKVWVAVCERHTERKNSAACACPVSERTVKRVTVEELKPKDVLITPDKIPCGEEALDPRRAYVEGLYVADGSKGHETGPSFQIAGRDGFPREEQKREVQGLCEQLGIQTSWGKAVISVHDRDWADRIGAMGRIAWVKRILSLNLDEAATRETLRGALVDSGRNTNGGGRTFTTSSPELHLQVRVLLKSLGISCSERYVPDHGSTSEHAVWRLGIRECPALDSLGTIRDRAWRTSAVKKANPEHRAKLLRVKDVIRDEAEAECFDIATDDHYVWLPEADWSTSQCDDHSMTVAALALAAGHRAAFRTVKGDAQRPDAWSHVYPVIGVVKGGQTEWYAADTTQQQSSLGWDPPESKLFGMATWVLDPDITVEDRQWH